jgi:hypothetical protein
MATILLKALTESTFSEPNPKEGDGSFGSEKKRSDR